MTATKLRRLETLEELDGGGECPHGWQVVLVQPGQAEGPVEPCEICGALRSRIVVKHVEGRKGEREDD